MKPLSLAIALVVLSLGAPTMAQQTTVSSPAMEEFKALRMKMMQDIQAPLSGDADLDFMRQMRSHHQQALEMAKVEMKHGKDAQARDLATSIIDQQTKEIAIIDRWLATRGK